MEIKLTCLQENVLYFGTILIFLDLQLVLFYLFNIKIEQIPAKWGLWTLERIPGEPSRARFLNAFMVADSYVMVASLRMNQPP